MHKIDCYTYDCASAQVYVESIFTRHKPVMLLLLVMSLVNILGHLFRIVFDKMEKRKMLFLLCYSVS